MKTKFLTINKRKIAYSLSINALNPSDPVIVFLGGFMSNMDGTKALFLDKFCKKNKLNFLRFDYSGHGKSSGSFKDFCISDWKNDTLGVINSLINGPVVLIGSSMGGWISLIISKHLKNIIGMICIAAAPDFTKDKIWKGFTKAQKKEIKSNGFVELPSSYPDSPYLITHKLIIDGEKNLIGDKLIKLEFPVRLLQGTSDKEVDLSTALKLLKNIRCDDIDLTLVKNADHQFSNFRSLEKIKDKVKEILRFN